MASIELTECIESVRQLIANNIRERVVGPDSATKAQDLMSAPGPRWFTQPSHSVDDPFGLQA